jgi:hypothetical protein
MRKIFGPKRDEVIGGWRKLHNEEFHNLYSSPCIIRMIISRRLRWAGHVARMGRRGMHIGFWWESKKDRDHTAYTVRNGEISLQSKPTARKSMFTKRISVASPN